MRAIDYFDASADAHGRQTAIEGAGPTYTYAALRNASRKISRVLNEMAPQHRVSRVAMYSHNDDAVLICMLGALRAGAAWIQINPAYTANQNIEYMKFIKPEVLFYESALADTSMEMANTVPSIALAVCTDRNDVSPHSLQSILAGPPPEEQDWGALHGDADRPVFFRQTSGTSGTPKVVVLDGAYWDTFMQTFRHLVARQGCRPVALAATSLLFGAWPLAFATLTLGGSNVIMRDFDARLTLENIERYQITHIALPPTALHELLSSPVLHDFDYSSLKCIILLGSAVSPEKLHAAVRAFGPCIGQLYGQTEAGLLTYLDPSEIASAIDGDRPERLMSAGRTALTARVAIMATDGTLLPPNGEGEIVVRGNCVREYIGNSAATEEVRRFGWHCTGDIGHFDDRGYLYVTGRKKDIIITGGCNVYAAEVEQAILALPEVSECAVIAVPDERWGEAIKAIINVAPAETLTADSVLAHCKARLGPVRSPKSVEFWDAIPKTSLGKLDKIAIRSRFWGGVVRQVN